MKRLLLLLAIALTGSALAQTGTGTSNYGTGILFVTSAPTGACSATAPLQFVASTGILYGCIGGNWGAISGVSGSSGSPVASGQLCQFSFLNNSGATVSDISGHGNNITFPGGANNPPWIGAPTGGVGPFAASQYLPLPTACTATARTIEIFYSYQSSGTQSRQVLYQNGGEFVDFYNNRYYQNTTAGNLGFSNLKLDVAAGNAYAMVTNGTFLFTMLTGTTADSTTDALYRNSDPWQYTNPPLVSSAVLSKWGDSGSIGNATTLGYNDVNLFFGGNIYYAIFYNRRLTAAEIVQNSTFVNNAMLARGVNSLPTSALPVGNTAALDNQLVCDGDSITAYSAGQPRSPYCDFLTLNNGPWTIGNLAITSQSIGALAQSANTGVLAALTPLAQKSAVIIDAGTNDIVAYGGSITTAEDNLVLYCGKVRKAGAKCFVGTMISRNGGDTQKNTYGSWVRANYSSFADGLVDFGMTALGADGASASGAPLFFTDQVHPLTEAEINIMAPVANHTINAYYGNRNWTTATTYAAAATAAVATTAGSEATNTVTITFGATPANCQVGNTIVIAGTTPAGYSNSAANSPSWLILTRTATQITYYNGTTGLGAITVQGTGVCPQQQDADVYTYLNFAGAHTLQSCVVWGPDTRYFKNINAGSPVLTPFGTETIDGAASFTMTAGSLVPVGLQSVLTSSSAAGCSLKRTQ